MFLNLFDKIIGEPKFANILWPHRPVGCMYCDIDCFKKITLGSLLTIYKNEPRYSLICPKCGGTAYLVFVVISLLSGCIYRSKHLCVNCKEIIKDARSEIEYGIIKRCCKNAIPQQLDIKLFHITQLINLNKE